MDLIYKVTGRYLDGKPILQQMEHQGRAKELYVLRFAAVYAVTLRGAKAIQRQYQRHYREKEVKSD
jgi:hypothetical protein